jgi:hypothetical protein
MTHVEANKPPASRISSRLIRVSAGHLDESSDNPSAAPNDLANPAACSGAETGAGEWGIQPSLAAADGSERRSRRVVNTDKAPGREIHPPGADKSDEVVDYKQSRPRVSTAASLMSRAFPPIKYVVAGYIAEGCTLLAGRPKLGKSWLVLDLALAVAAGRCCWGDSKCEKGEVLYLALEDNERRLQSRIGKVLGSGTCAPADFEYATEWPRGSDGLREIESWIRRKENPRLVVVDVLAMFRPTSLGNKSSTQYEADYQAIKGLQELGGRYGVAVVVVTHTRKGEHDGDPFEKVSGTQGLAGAADTVMVLDRDGKGATVYVRGRDIEELEAAIEFNRHTCRWTILGDASQVRRTDERSAILSALRQAGEPLTPTEISDATGMKNQNVRRLLITMVRAGEVTKVKRGLYENPNHTDHKITNTPDPAD